MKNTVYKIERGRNIWRYSLAVFIFSVIFFFGYYPADSISKGFSTAVSPTPTPNTANDLFSVELDRNRFIVPCPPDYSCKHAAADSAPLVIMVFGIKGNDNSLRYKHTTTGGRIIGEGAKVSWDLTGGQPGTYQITVTIEDKSGNELQAITKTITVVNYEDDAHKCLICPELSVVAPNAPTEVGETIIFTAIVSRGFDEGIVYKWTVSSGKIIEGQGTSAIKVATSQEMIGKPVEATVVLQWDCSDICRNDHATASGLVATKKRRGK